MLCCPTMPYLWPLNDGFQPGQLIRIKGVFPYSSNRFDINLQVGHKHSVSNIPLHISFRQGEGAIVLNTMDCGGWLCEQRHNLPILRGSRFEVVITCEPQQFGLKIDGTYCCYFRHRLPVTRIDQLNVTEDVTLTMISLESKDTSCCNCHPPIDVR